MLLLQTQSLLDDNVIVSSLPHPISMFLMGMFTILFIVMYREYVSVRKRYDELKRDMERVVDKMEKHTTTVDEKLMFISKKVDSRVDKALYGKK